MIFITSFNTVCKLLAVCIGLILVLAVESVDGWSDTQLVISVPNKEIIITKIRLIKDSFILKMLLVGILLWTPPCHMRMTA
jgi:hypothetical protein